MKLKVGDQVMCVRPQSGLKDLKGVDGAIGVIVAPLRNRRMATFNAVWPTYMVLVDGLEMRAKPEWIRKLPPPVKSASWDESEWKPLSLELMVSEHD